MPIHSTLMQSCTHIPRATSASVHRYHPSSTWLSIIWSALCTRLVSGELRVLLQCKAAKENPATFGVAPLNDPSTLHHWIVSSLKAPQNATESLTAAILATPREGWSQYAGACKFRETGTMQAGVNEQSTSDPNTFLPFVLLGHVCKIILYWPASPLLTRGRIARTCDYIGGGFGWYLDIKCPSASLHPLPHLLAWTNISWVDSTFQKLQRSKAAKQQSNRSCRPQLPLRKQSVASRRLSSVYPLFIFMVFLSYSILATNTPSVPLWSSWLLPLVLFE